MTKRFSRRELALLVSLPILLLGTPARAGDSLNFSDVTSQARAEQLAAEGRLVRILLFPSEFGGEDNNLNAVYVSPVVVEIRARLIGTLTRLIEDGLVDRMTVSPEYEGNSLVPVRLRFHATHSARSGEFNPVIEIWPVARLDPSAGPS